MHVVKRDLFHTADFSRVVEKGDPDAHHPFMRAGTVLDDSIARKYGLQPPLVKIEKEQAGSAGAGR